MKQPLISIILPTYNVADHIERCLASCLSQPFKDFEIIIVDDCGTDNSIEIANTYAKKDSRIKIIKHEKNLGTYHARKNGTYCAKGEFILYLDPDDELADNALSIINEQLNKHPELDLLLFNSQYIPEHKFWSVKPNVPTGVFKEKIAETILKEKKLNYGTPGKLYSLRAIKKGFDYLSIPENLRLVYGEDVLIFAGALLSINCAVGVSDKLYLYHRNETSITKIKETTAVENNISQLDLVLSYLNSLKEEAKLKSSIEIISNRLELDRLSLQKNLIETNGDYLKIMLKIFWKTKSWRVLVNLSIFFMTLTIKKP